MDTKLGLAAAKKFLIRAANGMVEPIPPNVAQKFGAALNAMNDLIALVTPVLSCPHNPLTCKGCIDNACLN